MDFVSLALIAAGGVAIFIVGHMHGTSQYKALTSKLSADLHNLAGNLASGAQMAAQQASQSTLGSVVNALEHPVQTAEHMMAQHHFTSLKASAKALWDDSTELAKIAEAQAVIAERDALRQQIPAILQALTKPAS